jgi:hypothetical protein
MFGSKKADKIGNMHFISFLSSTLSRLAYFNDNKFLTKYCAIFGPIIHSDILTKIDSVTHDKLEMLLDDQTLFDLLNSDIKKTVFSDIKKTVFSGKNYIDYIAEEMPQNINITNEDLTGNLTKAVLPQSVDANVKYISIGWSNYGEIFVVADKKMPTTIFLIFRGTYSAKTASLYSKPSSIIPINVCTDSNGNPEQFLYGIFKTTTEMIHTIIEAIRYLAINFLNATETNSVKIFTTGHSLGGAMCTIFSYLWSGIKLKHPYNSEPYNVLASNIICVSLGSPRCMSKFVANKFCEMVKNKQILYLRITTRGDPVPALPPKIGFEHPCSSDPIMRAQISEDCNSQLTIRTGKLDINYAGNIDCQNYKTKTIYLPNPISHTIYLDILYTKAVDILKFLKGIGIAQEVQRGPKGSTFCRLIMGELHENKKTFKAIFFDVNDSRKTPTNIDIVEEAELNKVDTTNATGQLQILEPTSLPTQIVGGKMFSKMFSTTQPNQTTQNRQTTRGRTVAEDLRITQSAFDSLIEQMTQLNENNLCPQQNPQIEPIKEGTFTQELMPDLSCSKIQTAGKKYKKKTKKSRKTTQFRKTKKYFNQKRHKTKKINSKCRKTKNIYY